MNRTFWEKIKDFFCCCRKPPARTGSEFSNANFSFDDENMESFCTESNANISKIEDSKEDHDINIKIENRPETTQSNDNKTGKEKSSTENSEKYKKYAMEKLGLSEKECHKGEENKKTSEIVESLKDITSIKKDSNIKQIKILEESKSSKIEKIEKILSDIKKSTVSQNITNTAKDTKESSHSENTKYTEKSSSENNYQKNTDIDESDITNDLNNKSDSTYKKSNSTLKDKNRDYIKERTVNKENSSESKKSLKPQKNKKFSPVLSSETLSNSSMSLNNFKRTVKEESSSSKDSEITCFLKYYDDKNYSKCIAEKMKKHLNKK
ncbi:hypothetical protein EHP00_1801 [Ecytonucleospora hepatopenaei]|uniref:Uncharacterized protein n=1 Tax=Ecytonucleospora hepatopenaei TaxID=646526 RepID=A0A1W0E408_9MICR|nr:hypothetical protein EHP00_1801 [Ecytonucleospora hepatopenaei]